MSYAIVFSNNEKYLGGLYYSSYFKMDINNLLNEVFEIINSYNSSYSIKSEDFYKSMILMFNTYKNMEAMGYTIEEYEPFIDNWSEDFLLKRFPTETFSFNKNDYRIISFQEEQIKNFMMFSSGYIVIDLNNATIKLHLFKEVNENEFVEWRAKNAITEIPIILTGGGVYDSTMNIRMNQFEDIKRCFETLVKGYVTGNKYFIPGIKFEKI